MSTEAFTTIMSVAQAVYDGTTPHLVAEAALETAGYSNNGSMEVLAQAGAASRGADHDQRIEAEVLRPMAEDFAEALRPLLTAEYQKVIDRFAGMEAETPSVSSLRKALALAEGKLDDAQKVIRAKEYQQVVDRFSGGMEPEGNVKLAKGIEEHAASTAYDVPEGYDLVQMERGGWRFVSRMYGMPSTAAEAARDHDRNVPVITTECSIVGFGRKTRTGGMSVFAVSLAGGNQTGAVGLNITADEYEALVGAEHLGVPYRLTITKADR